LAIYHVSKNGSDKNNGSFDAPFLTIQKAADMAASGDKIIVHEGVYREWVKPRNGGLSDSCRIIYEAAEGERVIIKGSERITGWENVEGTVWKVTIPHSFFGSYNPYVKKIEGDWLIGPQDYAVHTGEIYLNGKSFYEVGSLEKVLNPTKLYFSPHETWGNRKEAILDPEQTLYTWYCENNDGNTILYANFHDANPNEELVEINVRQSCFFPEQTGINYITVRRFEMAQAATPWSPPTAEQPGLIGPNWSKGWIIENNIIHDAKCSAISLGKEASTGNNDFSKWRRKPGYQNQLEAVFKARNIGWAKERIGSHIVRNNKIYDCGQNGIVGHLGCIFSQIYDNEIYNIAVKHEFYGHEIGGIKLHAAIDVQMIHNYIHNCALGTWLDWQAQGTRVSRNIFDQNNRDFMIEVTHGPCLVDQNIFTSPYCFDNAAQATAFVHNLCCGFTNQYPVLNRSTPYHLPHSTEVLGSAIVYGFDDRWYQNIFVGGTEEDRFYGTNLYNGAPTSLEEYIDEVRSLGVGDVENFEKVKQPAYIDGNIYLNGAKAFDREKNLYCSDVNPEVNIITEDTGVYLEITMPEESFTLPTEIITTETLGMSRITEARFENPDGSAIAITKDMLGHERTSKPVVGPLEVLKPGKNKVKIWDVQ